MNDRKQRTLQALFFLGLLGMTSVASGEDEDPVEIETIEPGQGLESESELRFGDPEAFSEDRFEEAIAPELTPSPPLKVAPVPSRAPSTSSPDSRVREILASIPADQAYPRELEELVLIGESAIAPLMLVFEEPSQSWQTRWVAAMALGRVGGEAARKSLERGLKDPLFLVRMASAGALAAAGDGATTDKLREALPDPAMVVRASVANALGKLQDRGSVSLLIRELRAERNFHRGKGLWVRGHIVDALGQIGDEAAIPALIGTLKEDDSEIRLKSCAALARLAPDAPPSKETQDLGCADRWLSWNSNSGDSLLNSPKN